MYVYTLVLLSIVSNYCLTTVQLTSTPITVKTTVGLL